MTLNPNNHQKAVLALILANFIWGAASPIFKWSLADIEPFTLAFLRFFPAALILFPFAIKKLKVQKEDWLKLVLISLAGITFNISFFFSGLKLAPSINAPIIATSAPLFLLIGCFCFLKEKLKTKILLGTLVGFVGVMIVILRPLVENGFETAIIGNLLFVLATISAVIHTILAKKIIPKYEPITITFWIFTLGALSFLPFLYLEVAKYGFLTDLALPGIIGIIFGVVFCSVLAYLLFHFALKNLWAQEVGIFTYLDPLVAILIAVPLLGEIPTPTYLLGGVLVFAGMFIAEGRIPYHPINFFLNHYRKISL